MDNSIDQLIAFIDARDPQFSAHIEGASAEQIARLEQACGRTLPPVYRAYLERLGRRSGWLANANTRFDIETLIRCHEFAGAVVVPDYLLIGRAMTEPRFDTYLWQESATQLRVVLLPPPPEEQQQRFVRDNRRWIAGSLPQMLADKAMAQFRHHLLPFHRQLDGAPVPGSTPRLPQVDTLLATQQLAPAWYANDWVRSYDAPDALVSACESPASGRLIIDIHAASQARLDTLLATVRPLVGPR